MSRPSSSPVAPRSSAPAPIRRRATAVVPDGVALPAPGAAGAVVRAARSAASALAVAATVAVLHVSRLLAAARLTLASAVGFAPGEPASGHLVRRRPRRLGAQTGQATAEYALVLLGAAVVAIALITWATGSGRIGALFDRVFDELQSRL